MDTQFSYLLEDQEYHSVTCDCAESQPLPHVTRVARLYQLDHAGLQALNDLLMENDEGESFDDWMHQQRPRTYYGLTEEVVRSQATQQARKAGMLIVNHLEAFPGVSPLINALTGLVGQDFVAGIHFSGSLPKALCECTSMHTREGLVCRACYVLLLCNILSTYNGSVCRERESNGEKETVYQRP